MKPYNTPNSQKEEIRSMFDAIAGRYDRLNHLLSLGIDRGWRRTLVRRVKASGAKKILDVATGTADLALMLAKACPGAAVEGIDLSEEMLAIGREKVVRAGLGGRIALRQGDAEALEAPSGSYDAVTVAFGVRNFDRIPAGLAEIFRVLAPGGKFWVLEFGLPSNKLLGALYGFYFRRVLPGLGHLLSRDGRAYAYLPRSVEAFPYGKGFMALMETAGFSGVRCTDLLGGVAQLYEGEKRAV